MTTYMRLMRSAQTAEDTGRAYQLVLSAVVRASKGATPKTIEADVFTQEIARLRDLVREMTESAAVDYAAAQRLRAFSTAAGRIADDLNGATIK